jgi:hypothetical protein
MQATTTLTAFGQRIKELSKETHIEWYGQGNLEYYRPNSYPDFCKRLSTFTLQNWPIQFVNFSFEKLN